MPSQSSAVGGRRKRRLLVARALPGWTSRQRTALLNRNLQRLSENHHAAATLIFQNRPLLSRVSVAEYLQPLLEPFRRQCMMGGSHYEYETSILFLFSRHPAGFSQDRRDCHRRDRLPVVAGARAGEQKQQAAHFSNRRWRHWRASARRVERSSASGMGG